MIWKAMLYENGQGLPLSLEKSAELMQRGALTQDAAGYGALARYHWGWRCIMVVGWRGSRWRVCVGCVRRVMRGARGGGVFGCAGLALLTKPLAGLRGLAVRFTVCSAPGQARGAEFGERCLIMPMTQAMDCLAILSRHLPGLARILSGDAPAATVFTCR